MKKRLVAFVLCVILLFSVNVNAYTVSLKPLDTENGEEMYAFFEQLMHVTATQYRYDITYEELMIEALKEVLINNPEMFAEFAKGAYAALDENSSYLTTEEFEERYTETMGQFAGIGVSIINDESQLIVASPMDGSPAMEAGIKAGDIIVSVDGEDITGYGMDKSISIIRGEIGTPVRIGIMRDNEYLEFELIRDIIKENPVVYEKLEKNNAGYVRITSFNANTSEYLKTALDDLKSQGVDKIILDLRDNPGGFLNEAVNVVSFFVPDNSLVVTESYKNPDKDVQHFSNPTDYKFKVVTLVNEYSASASEIVSGTINDYDVGPLVGVTTYGKGTVQTTLTLKNQDAIWLTVAQYNLPNGENIHKIGIQPDYYVENVYQSADYSKLTKHNPTRRLNIGDTGDDVLAVKERLALLNYDIPNMDNVYDEATFNAVARFQKNCGLYSYGIADFTTQDKLEEAIRTTKFLNDRQYTKALELIYDMK